MGSKSSAPPAPDYAGAARAQGAANVEAARAGSKLSNPSFKNPLGSRTIQYGATYDQDGNLVQTGDQDMVAISDNLTPLGQQRFDQEQRIVGQVGNLAEQGVGAVQNAVSKPFDFASAADARQQAQEALSGRLEPRLAQDRESLRTQLINSGFRPGTEGYDRAMKRADEQATDARLQVINQAGQEQDRSVQLANFLRNMPLNELNALRTGSQVAMPQFQNYSGSQVAPAPIFGATQAQGQHDMNAFNQKIGQQNAFTSGLFDLGAAGAMSFSDRRLKSNIKRIGTHPIGVGVYEYEIGGRHEVGVMADEVEKVLPQAVAEHESGYKMVDYSMLGGQ
jgi:hypothetical protein